MFMAKQSSSTLGLSIVSLIIIGVILILGVVGYFVYQNISVKVDIEVKPTLNEIHKNYTIEIRSHAYLPSMIEINLGDTVKWINKDSTLTHTITSDNYPLLRSDILKKDNSFSLTFTESGTYDYHCLNHPEYGKIIVR